MVSEALRASPVVQQQFVDLARHAMRPHRRVIKVTEDGKARRIGVERRGCGIIKKNDQRFWFYDFNVNDTWRDYEVLRRGQDPVISSSTLAFASAAYGLAPIHAARCAEPQSRDDQAARYVRARSAYRYADCESAKFSLGRRTARSERKDRRLPIIDKALVRIFRFGLVLRKCRPISVKVQKCNFLIVALGANTHLNKLFRKTPRSDRLLDPSFGSFGIFSARGGGGRW